MRSFTALGLVVALAAPLAAQSSSSRLLADVRHLSDDSLEGRLTGTPGADSAAAYVARRFAEVGLKPPDSGWFQDFIVSPDAPAARHAPVGGARGRNVIGLIRGADSRLRSELVVVGAHYDHLGLGGPFALDPDSTGIVHNGADDNASGTAALIEIATRLARRPPARSVAFVAFGGEELGLLGSAHYVRESGDASRIAAMLNLDMVGRLRNDRLIVYGTGSAGEFPALLDSLNRTARFELALRPDGYGPSDQSSFYAAGVPVLHVVTNVHDDYHRSTDDWQKVDVAGLERVAAFGAGMAAAIANRPARLTFVSLPVTAHGGSATGTGGYGAYLGTVPDMSGSESGVRLSGVRAGSPAEKAGLKADDVITKIGDYEVPDLEAMTSALRSYKPGDTVEIVVRRDGRLATVTATFGSRGT